MIFLFCFTYSSFSTFNPSCFFLFAFKFVQVFTVFVHMNYINLKMEESFQCPLWHRSGNNIWVGRRSLGSLSSFWNKKLIHWGRATPLALGHWWVLTTAWGMSEALFFKEGQEKTIPMRPTEIQNMPKNQESYGSSGRALDSPAWGPAFDSRKMAGEKKKSLKPSLNQNNNFKEQQNANG